MLDVYKATYTDERGCEDICISNNGEKLTTIIRDVTFQGSDFDALDPIKNTDPLLLKQFQLSCDSLCSCRFNWEMTIDVATDDKTVSGILSCELNLGYPMSNKCIDKEELLLTLHFGRQSFSSTGKSGYFEDELLSIHQQLPNDTYIKACINCLYSAYSPYGHGLFGCMLCFRNRKGDYLKIQSKGDFWGIHDHFERQVQETYLCPEFQLRVSGIGYRG